MALVGSKSKRRIQFLVDYIRVGAKAQECDHCSIIAACGCPFQCCTAHCVSYIDVARVAEDFCLQVLQGQAEDDFVNGRELLVLNELTVSGDAPKDFYNAAFEITS